MKNYLTTKLNLTIDELIKTDLGITNDNYRALIGSQQFIIRVPKDDVKHLFNRSNEAKTLAYISDTNLSLPMISYDENSGIAVSSYLDTLLTFNQYQNLDKIEKTVNLMKKLHQISADDIEPFNPIAMIYRYFDNIRNIEINLDDYQALFNWYRQHQFEAVLCHNDWVDGNICFVNDDAYLIDFEYAGLNDPLFDVMSFITENDLTNQEKKAFVTGYFDNIINDETIHNLIMYRDINNLLWYLWAAMMYELRNEDIFNEIKHDKYNSLINQYQTPLTFLD